MKKMIILTLTVLFPIMNCFVAEATGINLESGDYSYELVSINPPEVALSNFNSGKFSSRIDVPDKIVTEAGEFAVVAITAKFAYVDTLGISASIRYINPELFLNVSDYYDVDEDNQHYSDLQGALYTKDFKTLLRWPESKKFDDDCHLADGVEVLGRKSFHLVHINTQDERFLPSSIKVIDKECFRESFVTTPLVTIPDKVVEITDSVFVSCQFKKILLPENLANISKNAFLDFVGKVDIVDSNDSLGIFSNILYDKKSGAVLFALTNKLEEIEFPHYITFISSIYFPELKKVSFLNPDTELGDRAFCNCCKLEQIVLPAGLKRIGTRAFFNTNLREIQIPDGVESIGDFAFATTPLVSVVFPESVKNIGNQAFAKSQLTEVALPESLVTLGTEVFGNTPLESIRFNTTMKEIPDYLCANTKLTDVVLPESVEALGTGVFENTPLTNIQLPSGITEIPKDFCKNTKLSNIDIPRSVVKIGESAFASAKFKKNQYRRQH